MFERVILGISFILVFMVGRFVATSPLTATATSATTQSSADWINSVFYLKASKLGPDAFVANASGVWTQVGSKQVMLTAEHFCRDLEAYTIIMASNSSVNGTFQIKFKDSTADLCILESIDPDFTAKALTVAEKPALVNQSLNSYAFRPYALNHVGLLQQAVVLELGDDWPNRETRPYPSSLVSVHGVFMKGASGSPLLNSKYEIVGILTETSYPQRPIGYYRSIRTLKAFLVKYSQTQLNQ